MSVVFQRSAGMVTRRSQYTSDREENSLENSTRRAIRLHALALRAAYLFKEAEEANDRADVSLGAPVTPAGDFGIEREQLAALSRDRHLDVLKGYGGVEGLSDMLKTDLEKGICGDGDEIQKRKNEFGANTYPRKQCRSFWRFAWEASKDPTLIISMLVPVPCLLLGIMKEGIAQGLFDAVVVASPVIIVIFGTAGADYWRCWRLDKEKSSTRLEVIRNGKRVGISKKDIIVGDVIPLNIGGHVPADGVLISGHSLKIDESNIAGETDPKIVQKTPEKDPFLVSGSKITDGFGKMLVNSVGVNTQWGSRMASRSEDFEDIHEKTPLQRRLDRISTSISVVGLLVAFVAWLVLLTRYFTGHLEISSEGEKIQRFVKGETDVGLAIEGVLIITTIVATIVDVAAAEGLQLAFTLIFTYFVRKTFAEKVLVCKPSAFETMASVTTICCNETGTLTSNEMKVVEVHNGEGRIDQPGIFSQMPPELQSLVIEGIALNTNSNLFDPDDGSGVKVFESSTERAILDWAIKLEVNFDAARAQFSVMHVRPFNSDKKQSAVALRVSDSEVRIHWKGDAEIVLASCTQYMAATGSLVAMDDDKVNHFRKVIEDMAAKSLHCVAIAYRSYEAEKVPNDEEELSEWALPKDDLILLAIIGIQDPVPQNVKDSVKIFQEAGVKVRMVTVDNIHTAKAVALECGILVSDSDATEPNLIDGKIFESLSKSEREDLAESILVMSRASPNARLLFVEALRNKGHVVAVTENGATDAPAMRKAHIVIAMGQGTEVAKEMADIIILNDNFASIPKVVHWGRSMYACFQMFILFQLTANMAALVISAVEAIISCDDPLGSTKLPFLDIVMLILGALAFAAEPPIDHLMRRPPVGRSSTTNLDEWKSSEPLITNTMWSELLINVTYQVTVLLVLYFQGRSILHLQQVNADGVKDAVILDTFVHCQIFNAFHSSRPYEKNIFRRSLRNHLYTGMLVIARVLLAVPIEYFKHSLNLGSTVRLSWTVWSVTVGIGFIGWLLGFMGKVVPVPETPVVSEFIQLRIDQLIRLVRSCCWFPRGRTPALVECGSGCGPDCTPWPP